MTQIYPTIRSMTYEEAQHYRLFNPGLMLNLDTSTYKLSAGTTDTIYCYEHSVVIYILTINTHLSYCSLQAFIGSEDEAIESIFLQGEAAIQEFVGVSWRNLSLDALISRLTRFLG